MKNNNLDKNNLNTSQNNINSLSIIDTPINQSLINLSSNSSFNALDAGSGTGLQGEYYDNIDFKNLKLTRTDANVNFDFGGSSPDTSIGVDTFSIRWTGQLEAQFNEAYTFYTTTDDGVRLFVNDQLVINNFRDQSATEVASTPITLAAGQKYNIKLEYYEKGGLAVSKLGWSSASQVKQIIPQSQLFSSVSTTPTALLNSPISPTNSTTSYDFTVSYSDDTEINVSSLDNTDIRVTNTNGFNQLATFVSVTPTVNGTPRTATYRINAPGGTWDTADIGNYTVALQANQVSDTNGNFATASNLGSFQFTIPSGGTGLRGEYYDNIDFTNLKLTRTDANVNFDFGGSSPDTSIGVDTFSIRWTGQLEAQFNEAYTFYTTTDDGVRLFVNDQLVINNFRDQSATEVASTPITLAAGQKYNIKLEYYEKGGLAVSKLGWSSASQVKQIIPQSQLFLPDTIIPTASLNSTTSPTNGTTTYDFTITYSDNAGINVSSLDNTDIRVSNGNGFNQLATFVSVTPTVNGTSRTATYRITAPGGTWETADNGSYTIALQANQISDTSGNFAATGNLGNFLVNIAATSTGTGLRGEYYDNIDFTNLKLTRTDATINYNWGNSSPDPSIDVDTFSVKWTGQIEAKYNETYTFYSTTDDGVRVRINNQLVINRFVDQPPTQASGAITLQAGQKYDIEVDYYENGGGAVAKLEWASLTQVRQIVPSTQLYPSKRLPAIALGTVPTYIGEDEGTVQVQVLRSGEDLSETSTVKYSTVGATATSDLDFTKTEGTLTFAPGETSKFVTIPIINDTLLEANETFNFVVDQATGANLGTQRTGTITIIDNENTDITIVSPRVNENVGSAIVTVIRGNATSAATVNYTTSTEPDDTAQPVNDYQSVSGILNFAVGERNKQIPIPIVNNIIGEPNETFTIKFSNPTGGITLNAADRAKITIIDDDPGNITRETLVSGLTEPTSFEWIPNTNNLLIAQKDGIVRVVKNGQLQTTPFIDITTEVNNIRDRGLLSITIHPDFQNNPYVYLLYTYDPPEVFSNNPAINNPNSVLDNPDREGNRPSRLLRVRATTDPSGNIIFDPNSTATDNRVVLLGKNSNWQFTSRPDGNSTDVKVLPNTTTIDFQANFAPSGIVKQTGIGNGQLFTNMADYYNNLSNITNIQDYLATDSESHSVGYIKFGIDGKLYITNGDGTSYNRVDPRSIRVQDIDNLSGKLLRIDPITGQGVADNPFYQTSDPNSNRSKVYYSGLRNPFRFTIDDTTGKPYIGDVGWNSWEEINSGNPGSNFGWPYFEGGFPNSLQQPGYAGISYTTLSGQVIQPAQTFYASGQPVVTPVYAYPHFGSNAIIMGDFYTGNNLPSIYQNTLFIADISQSTVDSVTLNSQGQFISIQRFDTGFANIGAPVQITTDADGFLYFADLAGGTIKRWRTIA